MSKYKIYSKSGCIFCDAAMDLLEKNNIKFEEIKIDNDAQSLAFLRLKNLRTVPQIWNENDEHIGGYTDLKAILNG
jgi:glutaredoxin 1